jgi:hypothetical protein
MQNQLSSNLSFSLEDLARQQINNIADELKLSWELLCRGIEYQILDEDELEELISYLNVKSDYIVDELGFEFLGEQLRVKFLVDETYCMPEMMIVELNKLRQSISLNR